MFWKTTSVGTFQTFASRVCNGELLQALLAEDGLETQDALLDLPGNLSLLFPSLGPR